MDPEVLAAQPPTADQSAALTIGDLAERAGVTPAVLRMWETRHGFPIPQRLDSGHRRYTARDVDAVREVLRRKAAGVRLETAIAGAVAAAQQPPTHPSVFATVRQRHPGLPIQRLRKTTLVALSHAIEDESCAGADRPVLFGAFQRHAFYRSSRSRWTELARVARAAIVFADEWGEDPDATGGPVAVRLAPDAPMRREWAVICDSATSPACLTAWEIPGQDALPDGRRIFESIWTTDPGVVRDAARVAAQVAVDAGVESAADLIAHLAEPADHPGPFAAARAERLLHRALAYVDRSIDPAPAAPPPR